MSGPWEKYKAPATASSNGPWAKYKASAEAPEESMWDSAKRNMAGYTAAANEAAPFSGLMDKAVAGTYAGAQEIGDVFRDDKNKKPFSERYSEALKQEKDWRDKAKAAAPDAATAGNIAGSATNFTMGAVGGGPVGRVVGSAALAGVDQGTRNDDKLFDPEKAADAATLAGMFGVGGEALGAAAQSKPAQAAAGYIGDKTKGLADYLKKMANFRAVKAVTGQNKAFIKKAYKQDMIDKMGSDLLSDDEAGKKVLGWIDSSSSVAPKIEAKKEFFGKKLGNISDKVDEAMPNAVSSKEIAQDILDSGSKISPLKKNKGLIDTAQEEAANFDNMGDMSFKQSQAFKKDLKQGSGDYTREASKRNLDADMYNAVKKAQNNAVTRIGETTDDPALKSLLGDYTNTKGKYKSYTNLNDAAENRAISDMSNRFESPQDSAVGAITALKSASMGPAALAKGVIAGGANKLRRTYGSAFTANAANKVSKLLNEAPETFGKYAGMLQKAQSEGNQAFALTNYLLSQKDPEYNDFLKTVGGSEP